MLDHNRILVSFSGGRTSAYMTKRLVDQYKGSGVELAIVFANTGAEHPNTLKFVHECDKAWGLGVVWVEADIRLKIGQGTRARVVNYETASRQCEPFEPMIDKYGIPNMSQPHCTRELKLHPLHSYIKHNLGWLPGSYHTAVGIRADEVDRVSYGGLKTQYIYPLVEWSVNKSMVLNWWRDQAFDLDVPEHLGNCMWCWKKSTRKLMTAAQDNPSIFEFPALMELTKGGCGALAKKTGESQTFYRKHLSALDILKMSEDLPASERFDAQQAYNDDLDAGGACGESCEIGADEQLSLIDYLNQ